MCYQQGRTSENDIFFGKNLKLPTKLIQLHRCPALKVSELCTNVNLGWFVNYQLNPKFKVHINPTVDQLLNREKLFWSIGGKVSKITITSNIGESAPKVICLNITIKWCLFNVCSRPYVKVQMQYANKDLTGNYNYGRNFCWATKTLSACYSANGAL